MCVSTKPTTCRRQTIAKTAIPREVKSSDSSVSEVKFLIFWMFCILMSGLKMNFICYFWWQKILSLIFSSSNYYFFSLILFCLLLVGLAGGIQVLLQQSISTWSIYLLLLPYHFIFVIVWWHPSHSFEEEQEDCGKKENYSYLEPTNYCQMKMTYKPANHYDIELVKRTISPAN